MNGKVISLSRGLGANRKRLFALVEYDNSRPGLHDVRFELCACDPDDECEAWVAVRGPAVDEEFVRLAKSYGWNTELAKLAPAPTTKAKTSEWSHDH